MATYNLTSSIPSSSSLKTGDILNCPYSGTYKNIALPKGTYKLECWGAQGGQGRYDYLSADPGKGGYSQGILSLTTNTSLYLYSGGMGQAGLQNATGNPVLGGFNGGGNSGQNGSSNHNNGGGSGGGASDIRIGSTSLYARVIVAGGGGAGGNSWSGSAATGGYGGGTTGGDGASGGTGNLSAGTNNWGSPGGSGSQTSGGVAGIYSTGNGNPGSFGQGGSGCVSANNSAGGGGGGGWYGGGAGAQGYSAGSGGGGGGSGYVYTSSTASNYPSGCLLNSSYHLASASTIAGNSSFTSPTGSSETGHSGNGYIRITVQSIMNWAYSTVSISAPTYNKQNTSSWTLSPSTCRYFSFTPTISGDFIVYSNSSMDTYGYLTSNITSLNSNGQPSSNVLVSDDDGARKYGGTGANFGICYKVTAGTTYYIYVKPYRDSTASSSVYLTYYMAHPDSRVYVKTDSTTWKLITN